MYASTLLVEMVQKFLAALGGAHMRLCVCVRVCVFLLFLGNNLFHGSLRLSRPDFLGYN